MLKRYRHSAILLIAYLMAAWFGIMFTPIPPGNLSILWLPSGIALIGLLTFGFQVIPAIFIGSLLSNSPFLMSTETIELWLQTGTHSIISALLDTTQATIAYTFYRRWVRDGALRDMPNFMTFVIGVSLLPAMLTSWAMLLNLFIGGYVDLNNATDWKTSIYNLTLADTLGVFLLVPLYESLRHFRWKNLRQADLGQFASMMIFLGIVIFWLFFRDNGYPVALILPMTAIALTTGLLGTSVAFFLVTAVSLVLTVNGFGPFVVTMSGTSSYGLLFVMIGLGIPCYLIAISKHNSLKLTADLERRVRDRTKELAELNQNKDRLLSIIAHDLRNPMQGIVGLSSIAIDDINNKQHGDLGSYVEMIQGSAQQSLQLLQNLLDWSASQTGHMRFKPQSEDISKLVTETLHVVSDLAKSKSVTLSLDMELGLTARVDKSMMSTILRNLVSNSLKFTPTGGTVLTSAHSTEKGFRLVVTDNGVGMTQAKIQSLFNNSSNVSTHGTEGENGSGLGLLLVHEFTQKHHAIIHVDSEPGCGTTFTIDFPG